jgi:RNA polymerase sigma factor (sigma-70 family)
MLASWADTFPPDTPARRARLAGPLLATALADLPARDRDVVVLIAWEQLTYEETARALDIPVGTVRSRLNRARAGLRTALAGTGRHETFEEILSNE